MNTSSDQCAHRFELRDFAASDVTPEYVSWLNDKVLMQYSGQSCKEHSRLSCLEYLASFRDSPNFFWSIQRQPDGKTVGTMTAYLDERDSIADVGILIGDSSVRGTGVGRIAWGLAIDFLFKAKNLRKVTGGTVSDNTAMVRIFEHHGMTREGCLRSQQVLNGRIFDVVLYGLLQSEWAKK